MIELDENDTPSYIVDKWAYPYGVIIPSPLYKMNNPMPSIYIRRPNARYVGLAVAHAESGRIYYVALYFPYDNEATQYCSIQNDFVNNENR